MRKSRWSILLIVIGIAILFYPEANTVYQDYTYQKVNHTFAKENPKNNKKQDDRYQKAVSYNKKIGKNQQKELKETWIWESGSLPVEEFRDQQFGYVEIPKMEVRLPLYLGASEENMKKGAAVLGGTSLPIGGVNSNSVIAGHRGYQGAPYFREIEKIHPGDKVYVRNPWEKLTYFVESIRVIEPDDVEAIKIQKGRDMVTLITCHPYRSQGKYRYVVYCVKEEKVKRNKNMSQEVVFSSQKEIQEEKMIRQFCKIGMFFMIIFLFLSKGVKKWRKRKDRKS